MRRATVALLGLSACGGGSYIEPGPYSKADVKHAIALFGSAMETQHPDYVQDLYDYGFELTMAPKITCEGHRNAGGCTDGPDGLLARDRLYIQVQTDGQCIGTTALAHELVHTLGFLYGPKQEMDHSEPGLWIARDNLCSLEYEARADMVQAFCPPKGKIIRCTK